MSAVIEEALGALGAIVLVHEGRELTSELRRMIILMRLIPHQVTHKSLAMSRLNTRWFWLSLASLIGNDRARFAASTCSSVILSAMVPVSSTCFFSLPLRNVLSDQRSGRWA